MNKVMSILIIGIVVLIPLSSIHSQTKFNMDIPCLDCHSNEEWKPLAKPMTFDHRITSFALTGQHLSVSCIFCHKGESALQRHQFSDTSPECIDCHIDLHANSYGSDCEICHNPSSWNMSDWRRKHDDTYFPLTGMHVVIECNECHKYFSTDIYKSLSSDCYDCHQNVFVDAHSPQDNDDCIICHNTRGWLPVDMSNHDLLFPIYSGKHRGTWNDCTSECHINPSNYSQFSCGLNGICHEHDQSEMDKIHREEGLSGYKYESIACLTCHPTGEEGD